MLYMSLSELWTSESLIRPCNGWADLSAINLRCLAHGLTSKCTFHFRRNALSAKWLGRERRLLQMPRYSSKLKSRSR